MTTPEAAVKRKLRNVFQNYTDLFDYWPVPSGYGSASLDVLGCYRGRFFLVETKAKGRKPTLRQEILLAGAEKSMAKVFVIAGIDSPVFDELVEWLDNLKRTIPYDPHLTPSSVNRRII